ncbi:MAG: GGDEF domain-containing protein [Alphaproteobacteria bacterium]|nr:GGDEF domain-containing protein [Alphaproteobacteria bacterium]
MSQPRYPELCRRFPGPAAFIDRDGHVRDVNDAAAMMLDALERRPGGLAALAAAAGGPARFEWLDLPQPESRRLELAVVPVAEGLLLLARDRDPAFAENLSGALAESRARYKELVEISSDFAWETDAKGIFVFVSPRGALGHSPRELIGRMAGDILPEIGGDASAPSPFVARSRLDDAQVWVQRRDGEPALLSIAAVAIVDARGEWCGTRGVARDLTDMNERETALAAAEHRDRLLAHVLRSFVENDDPSAGLSAALRASVRSFGAAGGSLWRREAAGFTPAVSYGAELPDDLVVDALASSDGDGDGEAAMATRGDGRRLVLATTFRHLANGAIALWRAPTEPAWDAGDILFFARVAAQFGLALAQLDSQQELERQARTDGLTGLLNRRSFLGEIESRLASATRTGRPAALVYVDLDNFKPVNDRHGHAQGDAVLKTLADRLRRSVRTSDLVARLGGDEFALWLEEADMRGAEVKGKGLLALRADIDAFSAAPDLPLGLSIGIAVFDPNLRETVSQLIERADAAMYAAKRGGKGRLAMAPPRAAA